MQSKTGGGGGESSEEEEEESELRSGERKLSICSIVSYAVEVEPKVWLPVSLIEGRLCQEIKTNLLSVKRAAETRI